jgi:hypothetical protein
MMSSIARQLEASSRNARSSWTLGAVTMAVLVLLPAPANAFVFPEHRDIGVAAVNRLSSADRTQLEALWGMARPAFRGPICESLAKAEQGLAPKCIDFAALPAIAGDHSCSPKDVVQNVLPSTWILNVARVAAETKAALASADSPSAVFNRSATMNLELQNVDPDYLSRAGANSAHFLTVREQNDLGAYIEQSVRGGAPLNALGLYLQYHVAALALAQELALGTAAGNPRSVAARDVVALESFALHWLEDSFASGHAAGTWGGDAWRKGTHDYYGEHGLDMTTWAGERIVAFGDSNMKAADLERASKLVAQSLAQVLSALHPGDPLATSVRSLGPGIEAIYAFDSCKEEQQPSARGFGTLAAFPQLVALLRGLPMPGRGAKDIHLPRFRQEFGPFAGAFGGAAGSFVWDGGGESAIRPSVELGAGLRVGYAAPAIVGTIGTAKAFVETGFVMQSAQAQSCSSPDCGAFGLEGLLPRVPSRSGLRVGLRLPFYLVPGDMLLLGPVLLAVAPRSLPSVGITAMRGGLIPYERSFRTSAGTFQVVAGREADVTFFGYLSDALEVRPIAQDANGREVGGVVSTRSVRTRLPLVEWTPLRSFATNVTFAIPLQVGFGFEVPTTTTVVFPTGSADTRAVVSWDVFVRMQLDAQYFFGDREDTH